MIVEWHPPARHQGKRDDWITVTLVLPFRRDSQKGNESDVLQRHRD